MKKFWLFLLVLLTAVTLRAQTPFQITFGPYLQNVTEEGVTVIWGTSGDALSWVEVAPDGNDHFYAEERPQFFQTKLGRRTVGKLHTVRIRDLQPGTFYRYRVCSKEVLEMNPAKVVYGTTICTDIFRHLPLRFKTRSADQDSLALVIVNDIHENSEMLGNLLADVKKGGYDFVFFNGDMVNNMSSEQQLINGFLGKSTELFASEIPFYFARGNHETRGNFSDHYLDYFPTSTNEPYYAFRQGPVFFIVLDGGEDKPDSDIEYYGLADFDRYRADQVAWLKEVVATEAFRSAPFKVVITHVPPINTTWHGPLEVKKHFLPVLNEAGVDLMICGHLHAYHYIPAGESDCSFPVLINSNDASVSIHATSKSLNFKVQNAQKELVKEATLTK